MLHRPLASAAVLTLLTLVAGALAACSDPGDEESAAGGQAVSNGCAVVDFKTKDTLALASLDDPFAKLVLRDSATCPVTPDAVLALLKSKGKSEDGDDSQPIFAVSEHADEAKPTTDYRFVAAQRTATSELDELFVSILGTPKGLGSIVEVMSFSRELGAYRFYALEGERWVLHGDGTQITPGAAPAFQCAGCHTTGAPVMKELALPWNNWHSDSFQMPDPEVVDPSFKMDPKFKSLFERRGDAYALESSIRAGADRFHGARVDKILAGTVPGQSLKTILRHFMCDVGEPTLLSAQPAHTKRVSPITPGGPTLSLFNTQGFSSATQLVDSTLFFGLDGLKLEVSFALPEEHIEFPMTAYLKAIGASGQTVGGVPGDTIFPLFTADRSVADHAIMVALAKKQLVSRDVLIDLLMTDFTNPVFSKERCDLAATAPDKGGSAKDIRLAWIQNLQGSPLKGAAELTARLTDLEDFTKHTGSINTFLRACATQAKAAPEEFARDVVKLVSQQRNSFRMKFGNGKLRGTGGIIESNALLPEDTMTDTAPNTWRLSPTSCKLEKQ